MAMAEVRLRRQLPAVPVAEKEEQTRRSRGAAIRRLHRPPFGRGRDIHLDIGNGDEFADPK